MNAAAMTIPAGSLPREVVVAAGGSIYAPRGAARRLFYDRSPEIIIDGPAGTGKTRAILEKVHLVAENWPGSRGLIVRKTRASLTQSGLVTFQKHVLPPATDVRFHTQNQEFQYPNGSVVAVGGLDKDSKVMSSEYDIIAVIEATELVEADWEALSTRLRNGVVPFQQIIGDCNPASPSHWIRRRARAGHLVMHKSTHRDNPVLFDAESGTWTERGRDYLAKLEALSGLRRDRLYKGLWVSAEGIIYAAFDREKHVIDRFAVPSDWPRIWSVDFGYNNPFVWQCWAISPDGDLYLEHEIYRTGRLVEDHAREIKRIAKGFGRPLDVFCDHDAEDRATLERHLGITTTAAYKGVRPGIEAVQARLRVKQNGKAGLYFFRDALAEADPELAARKLPTCTVEEIEAYVWDQKRPDVPVKSNDHGCDAMRYAVAGVDDLARRNAPAEIADFNLLDL